MRITDELLDAIAACARRWNWERLGEASARERIREDLSHVFADIPDPEEVRDEIMSELAYGRSVENQRLEARIRELEAQQPTTVLELTKRVTALQMKLEEQRQHQLKTTGEWARAEEKLHLVGLLIADEKPMKDSDWRRALRSALKGEP